MDTRRNDAFKTTIATKVSPGRTQENGYQPRTQEYQSFAKYSMNHHLGDSQKARPWDHAIDLKPDAKPYAGKGLFFGQ